AARGSEQGLAAGEPVPGIGGTDVAFRIADDCIAPYADDGGDDLSHGESPENGGRVRTGAASGQMQEIVTSLSLVPRVARGNWTLVQIARQRRDQCSVGPASFRPRRSASCRRSRRPSLPKIEDRWALTVRSVMPSRRAT